MRDTVKAQSTAIVAQTSIQWPAVNKWEADHQPTQEWRKTVLQVGGEGGPAEIFTGSIAGLGGDRTQPVGARWMKVADLALGSALPPQEHPVGCLKHHHPSYKKDPGPAKKYPYSSHAYSQVCIAVRKPFPSPYCCLHAHTTAKTLLLSHPA